MKKLLAGFAVLFLSNTALAECVFDVDVGDNLAYSVSEITVDKTCAEVTINLKHTGTLPATAMGHNWVLTNTADVAALGTAGMGAGPQNNYVPVDDSRVFANTKIIGGGESTSVTFSIADLDPAGDYTYFCSFPGHWAAMKGTFKIS
ncbi:MAG: azurin [Pseudomonadota bacterium]